MDKKTILLIDDDKLIYHAIKIVLEAHYVVEWATSFNESVHFLDKNMPHAILLDIQLAEDNGLEILPNLIKLTHGCPILMLTGSTKPEQISHALKAGAFDYVSKPFQSEDLLFTLRKAMNHCENEHSLPYEFIGRSQSIQRIRRLAEKAAKTSANILIQGESGTGKEVMARMIHRMSEKKAFVAVNCAAVPSELIESTFFGHEKGSFTGATDLKRGKFEMADQGDLFLDEISCMPLNLQAKLLRVLQEKEFERVGGNRIIHSDFRVIAASNENLHEMIAKKAFREDLFYRLNIIEIDIPPLRQRPEDIPLLINYFLDQDDKNPDGKRINPEAKGMLAAYPWPGNARQLFHTLEQMLLLADEEELGINNIPQRIRSELMMGSNRAQNPRPVNEFKDALDDFERNFIERAIDTSNRNYSEAAKLLNISRSSLYSRMKRLGMGSDSLEQLN
ncbi:MAG TPA: sigma-54 dependent transcriptional regulator [Oligoflexia bacterium]|nr:sigma-54 dependent transcriptional regulator [Oligoflexia bacterium]HMR24512.1 sigma-54 dependent transcriptional regulator [Oligoflexia bacterium]